MYSTSLDKLKTIICKKIELNNNEHEQSRNCVPDRKNNNKMNSPTSFKSSGMTSIYRRFTSNFFSDLDKPSMSSIKFLNLSEKSQMGH